MNFKSPYQKKVYEFIRDFKENNGYYPSYWEIANGLELNTVSTVWEHIKNLQERGIIYKKKGTERKFELLK